MFTKLSGSALNIPAISILRACISRLISSSLTASSPVMIVGLTATMVDVVISIDEDTLFSSLSPGEYS